VDAFRAFHPSISAAPVGLASGPGRRVEPVQNAAVVVGVSGARQNATVALATSGRLIACCEQERITRVRSEGLRAGTLPAEALRALLGYGQAVHTGDVTFVAAEPEVVLPPAVSQASVDHHFAHAATAALTSPFRAAAVLVCDQHGNPPVSVWCWDGGRLARADWPCAGEGFADLYSQCAQLFGFGLRGEHRLEALARLDGSDRRDARESLIHYAGARLVARPEWGSTVARSLAAAGGAVGSARSATIAGSFQRSLGDALVALVQDIRRQFSHENLCLGGGLFYNTYLNTRIVESRAFTGVFVPINPGNAGVAVGAALAHSQGDRLESALVSPFLGPQFTMEEIKATLDNCKLVYEYLSEQAIVQTVVRELSRGALVGWFQGRMEWGHRSLGHRSILANPFAPHVLENLNAYLKQREPYRTYGLSVCEEEAPRHFHVCAPSRFMELEYALCDPQTFRHILPEGVRTLRVQTLAEDAGLFRELHQAFGRVAPGGVLVNTSFNGLHEPIVCTPRDAVRVFYGTGLDLLVLGQFLIRK
jgi:carbamoyltransferase